MGGQEPSMTMKNEHCSICDHCGKNYNWLAHSSCPFCEKLPLDFITQERHDNEISKLKRKLEIEKESKEHKIDQISELNTKYKKLRDMLESEYGACMDCVESRLNKGFGCDSCLRA